MDRIHKSRRCKYGFIETILKTMFFKGKCNLSLHGKSIILKQVYPNKRIKSRAILKKCRTHKMAAKEFMKYENWRLEAIHKHMASVKS